MQSIRSGILTLAFTASLLLWASIAVTPATAANVQFNFTGIVTAVTGDSTTQYGIQTGSGLTNGSYTVRHDTASIPDPINFPNTYAIPVTKLSFALGSVIVDNLGQNIPSSAGVLVVSHSSNNDFYVITTSFNQNGSLLGSLMVSLSNNDGSYLTGLPTLPSTPPDIGSFTTRTFHLNLFADGSITPTGTVDGIIAPVPLPPAVILFGAGLVALVGLGARNWRQRNLAS
jgi:hypothetical protein